MNELLEVPFTFPDVAGRKVLLLGLGGGCDIILAYAVAQLLPAVRAQSVIYANTKEGDQRHLEAVTNHIRRVPRELPAAGATKGRTHGTTLIDQSVPRGDQGCPWIVCLPRRNKETQLVQELRSLAFDLVFGVDTGGDSLVDHPSSGHHGRDKRMLRLLQQLGLPLFPIVIAPGSDGEASCGDLQQAFSEQLNLGRYRGCFALDPVLSLIEPLSKPLSGKRTPNIILAAAADHLKGQDGNVMVPRGRKPVVPKAWLTRGFVFADPTS